MDEATMKDDSSAAILAEILRDQRLQRYFHQAEMPERFPLQVIDAAGAKLSALDPASAGVPAVVVASPGQAEAGRAQLIVDRYSLQDGVAQVSFRFPVEGIAGDATLSRPAGEWRVDEMRIVER